MFVKPTILPMKTVVALKNIGKLVIREASKKTLNEIRVAPSMFTNQTGNRIIFLQKPRVKGKLMCMLHWEDLTNTMQKIRNTKQNISKILNIQEEANHHYQYHCQKSGRAQTSPTRAINITQANHNTAERININNLTKETISEAAKRNRGKPNMRF